MCTSIVDVLCVLCAYVQDGVLCMLCAALNTDNIRNTHVHEQPYKIIAQASDYSNSGSSLSVEASKPTKMTLSVLLF